MTSNPSTREESAFARYLESRTILIADPSSSSRSGLFGVFKGLGAKTNRIILVSSFNQAHQAIVSEKPNIVMAEYSFGARCGLELFQTQRAERPMETKDSVFVVVTSNSSQSAVARSAEEDIDAYILKPYTPDVVRKTIVQTVAAKMHPSQYLKKINQGKLAIEANELADAEKLFEEAISLDRAPSLAHYYVGLVNFLKKVLEQAQASYEAGLAFNQMHYKCLVGVYTLLMAQHRHEEAYKIVQTISKWFPANPRRLIEVLRLAIVTNRFEDIEKYYEVFLNIDEKEEALVKHICAALIVCGKYYLGNDPGNDKALGFFRKAAITSAGRPQVLKETILTLVDYDLAQEAKYFLDRFRPEELASDDYQLLCNAVSYGLGNFAAVGEQGRQLLAKGIVSERLYADLIGSYVNTGASDLAIEQILTEAISRFPEREKYFREKAQRTVA